MKVGDGSDFRAELRWGVNVAREGEEGADGGGQTNIRGTWAYPC